MCLLWQGCAGKPANPIRVATYKDAELTCSQIKTEVVDLVEQSGHKLSEEDSTDDSNLAVWIAGQIFLVPMLGMDVTGSAQIERAAIEKRMERLQTLASEKDC